MFSADNEILSDYVIVKLCEYLLNLTNDQFWQTILEMLKQFPKDLC